MKLRMRSRIVFLLTMILTAVQALNLPTYSTCTPSVATVTAARGRITSPNHPSHYPTRLDCKWNISSPKGAGIRMTIQHLDNKEVYEGGKGICNDKLHIASVDSRETTQYLHEDKELCAENVSELAKKVFEIQNSGDGVVIAQISFSSDYADQGTGFSIYFEALCNNTQTGESGTITSPNYPNEYPNYADCFTEIQAPFGSTIEIEFTNLQVENQVESKCQTDYVEVIEGPLGLYGTKRTRYCKTVAGVLSINSYIATVEFVSDGNLAHPGFSATWKAVFPTTTTISSTTTTTPTTTATTTITTTSTARTTTTLETKTIEMKNCSYTNESFLCQRWDTTKPHKPNHQPNDINHNYCRNPDNDSRGYWCYTTDPSRRWGYCDINNCLAPTTTTYQPTTNRIPATTSGAATSPLVAMFGGDPNIEKQTSDDTETTSGLPWYAYVVIAAALVAFVIVVLIFVLRRRKRKSSLVISEPNTSDTVAFSQYERDQYGERPRENTYVEIPFLGNIHESSALRDAAEADRNDMCGKGNFVALPAHQSKNSSVSSLDSIQLAKEAAQRNFSFDNRGASTSSANPYAVADDVAKEQAPPLPKDRVKRSLLGANVAVTDEANVYHSIETQQLSKNKGNAFAGTPLPPPPFVETKETTSKKEPSKKKSKEKKFLKKSSKSDLTPGAGFTNPSYREKDRPRDNFDEEINPFDTDDEALADEPSTYHVPPANQLRSESKVNEEDSNLYNVPSVIPIIPETEKVEESSEKKNHTSTDSPYMMPKISMPSKASTHAAMIPISPDLIDDNKKKEAFDNDLNLYSAPNPTSPTFEIIEDFTYDSPRDGRSPASSFTSKAESEGGQTDSSQRDSTRSARDSGNASLTAVDSIPEDKNNEEYCSMSSLSPLQMRRKEGNGDEAASENRLSHLYLSMKGIQADRRVSESSWKSTKKQTTNPRKSV